MEEIQGDGFVSAEKLEALDFYSAWLNISEGLDHLSKDAERLEQYLVTNEEFNVNEEAVIFLKDFCTMMSDLNSKFPHPNDFEKLFQTDNLIDKFASSIDKIKKLQIIDRVERLSNKKEEGYDPNDCEELVKTARGYMIQAEFYLSQFK